MHLGSASTSGVPLACLFPEPCANCCHHFTCASGAALWSALVLHSRLQRRRVARDIAAAARVLGSLSRTVLALPNLAMPDVIGQQVRRLLLPHCVCVCVHVRCARVRVYMHVCVRACVQLATTHHYVLWCMLQVQGALGSLHQAGLAADISEWLLGTVPPVPCLRTLHEGALCNRVLVWSGISHLLGLAVGRRSTFALLG